MTTERKLISIIIPVFNEEKNIPRIYLEIIKVWENLKDFYDYEIIFVNDGSKDDSFNEVKSISKGDKKVKCFNFSRNFGKEIALTAGINNSHGDAAIMIDADLQHPPELIPNFIKKWEDGADVVIGVRDKNNGEGIIKRWGSFCFYKAMNAIGETKMTPKSTDFRLIDKKVIQEFNRFTERTRITRGLLNWLGFSHDFVYFEANARAEGKAGYSCIKLVKLALSTFITHSLLPLQLAGYLGIIITFFSGLLGLFILIEKYILDDPLNMYFSGPATLAVIILFLVGIILSCLGLVALYIANIYNEVMNRPIYVVKDRLNSE